MVSEQLLDDIIRQTMYVPGALKTKMGFCSVLILAVPEAGSLKFQSHVTGKAAID
jgi:hypothetical protein